jgi:hypothetical protein
MGVIERRVRSFEKSAVAAGQEIALWCDRGQLHPGFIEQIVVALGLVAVVGIERDIALVARLPVVGTHHAQVIEIMRQMGADACQARDDLERHPVTVQRAGIELGMAGIVAEQPVARLAAPDPVFR